jgi:hypothetical protein
MSTGGLATATVRRCWCGCDAHSRRPPRARPRPERSARRCGRLHLLDRTLQHAELAASGSARTTQPTSESRPHVGPGRAEGQQPVDFLGLGAAIGDPPGREVSRSAGSEMRQYGQHTSVVIGLGKQTELGEDVAYVRFDCLGVKTEPVHDRLVRPPSTISARTSRSRRDRSSRGTRRRFRSKIRCAILPSIAVPPEPTRPRCGTIRSPWPTRRRHTVRRVGLARRAGQRRAPGAPIRCPARWMRVTARVPSRPV